MKHAKTAEARTDLESARARLGVIDSGAQVANCHSARPHFEEPPIVCQSARQHRALSVPPFGRVRLTGLDGGLYAQRFFCNNEAIR